MRSNTKKSEHKIILNIQDRKSQLSLNLHYKCNQQKFNDHNHQLIPVFDIQSIMMISTPHKKQPQFLQSPSPIKKDLFHQLLGTETKSPAPLRNISIMQEQYSELISFSAHEDNSKDSDNDEQKSSYDDHYCDDNAIRKRKRKSTNQIKMLKLQLNGEMNWSKQKIVEMAEITGLSQSQVYKWCWDQKKKTNRNRDGCNDIFHKRKFIKKDYSTRFSHNQKQPHQVDLQNFTKLKVGNMLIEEENINQTQKKVQKKLIFN